MILESLQKIKKAENEENNRVDNAKTEGIKIVKDAGNKAENLVADKIKKAHAQAEKARVEAGERAMIECKNISKEWKEKTDNLREAAKKNRPKATEFILQSLLG